MLTRTRADASGGRVAARDLARRDPLTILRARLLLFRLVLTRCVLVRCRLDDVFSVLHKSTMFVMLPVHTTSHSKFI